MSEGADEGQEKSFDATPQKLQKAREQGNIAVSQDVHAAAAYIGMIAALVAFGAAAAAAFGAALTPFLSGVDRLEGRILGPGGLMLSALMVATACVAALPLFIGPALGALASLLAQQAIVVAPSKLAPKLSRLSPIETAKKKFGPTGLMEFLKSAVKLFVIGTVTWFWLEGRAAQLIGLAAAPPREIGRALGEAMLSLLTIVAIVAAAIAAIDFVWQRFDHARQQRMTFEEMKKENKETEGDPAIKQKRRARAQEIASNRMLADVPKADVVIVNPTHYAVALKWTRAPGEAPECVAKGVDEMARKIRELAAEAGVPIHRDPPTARALHAEVEIGRQVRPEHYRAVAAAIRFSDQMRAKARRRKGGGGGAS